MWNERTAAFVVAFLLGVAVFAVWEAALSFHASNCSPQQQQAGQQTLNQQGAAAKKQSKDGDEHHDHEAVREPFVCTVAGIPTAIRIFMNRNEGFFVGGFTFMLVFVTGWLVWATLGLRESTDRLWEAGERQIDVAKQSADAAAEAAKAAELQARILLRAEQPLVIAQRFEGRVQQGTPINLPQLPEQFVVKFEIANHGRTPAEVESWCVQTVVTDKLPEMPEYDRIYPAAPGTLLNRGEDWKMSEIVTVQGRLHEALINETHHVWVYGFVKFKDFLGKGTKRVSPR